MSLLERFIPAESGLEKEIYKLISVLTLYHRIYISIHQCGCVRQYNSRMNDWWVKHIDVFKRRSRLSDVALAKRLDISPAMLAHVRVGRRTLPLQARLRLLDAIGYVITRDILIRILPEEVRSAVEDTNAALTESVNAAGSVDPNGHLELPPPWT